MKKYCTVLAVLLAMVCRAQQLPNSSFENWTLKNDYIEPDGWISTNAYAYFGAPETCYPFEEAHTGKWSAKLEIRIDPITGDTLQAIMVTGSDYEAPGIAYSHLPTGYSFYYKHNRRDTAVGAVFLTRWNAATHRRDTVASAFTIFLDSTNTFTQRTMPLTYFGSLRPDSCSVVFTASFKAKPTAGNYLILDDMAFTGFLSANEAFDKNATVVFPNPAGDKITVQSDDRVVATSVWTLDGKLLLQVASNNLIISDLRTGVYIVQAELEGGNTVVQKLIKE